MFKEFQIFQIFIFGLLMLNINKNSINIQYQSDIITSAKDVPIENSKAGEDPPGVADIG